MVGSMKTTVSIPDSLFVAAEELASTLGLTRSQLYEKAIAHFLASYSDKEITAKLDEVYARESSAPDPLLTAGQFASLEEEQW
jgi:predicted transcriptional regulator